MTAIPETVPPTIAAIERWHEGKQDADHYPFIRGSEIGKECERALWYRWRWAGEAERFEGRILRLFETGHRDEGRMIRDLRNAGIAVQDTEEGGYRQIAVAALDGHFKGHLDGIANNLPEAPKTAHLLECKTHNAKSFAQVVKHGVAVAKPEHMAQMQIYMHLAGLTRALYLAKNKDDESLYAERVKYDAAHASALIAKAERIRDANDAPPKISNDPEFWQCRFCNSHPVCHGGQFALRNCRTCLHSQPGAAGPEWYCTRHDHGLTVDDQKAGCPHHLYLPALVPGEQIDADEAAETVTYSLADGSDWTDGKERNAA